MGWFSRKPTQEKYVEAAVKVATNLYLHTIPGAEDALAADLNLKFSLQDSRYRYLLFCLSAAVAAALAYDEKKQVQPEALFKGCLFFATWIATEHANEYFDDPVSSQIAVSNTSEYLMGFFKQCRDGPHLRKKAETTRLTI